MSEEQNASGQSSDDNLDAAAFGRDAAGAPPAPPAAQIPVPASALPAGTEPGTVPVVVMTAERPGGILSGFRRRVLRPIPGAQPRLRFEMPPEVDAASTDATDIRSGIPAQRHFIQRPIYTGFMAAVGIGLALFLYYMLTHTAQLLLWIVAAMFISLGLDPVVRWLEGRKVPRPAGIVISVGVLVSLVAAFFATLIPTMVDQTSQLVQKAPGWITDFLNSDFFRTVDNQFHVRDTINEQVATFFQDSQTVGGIFGGVVGVGTTIANGLFGALIVLVLSLYFLASLPAMKRWAYRLAPRSKRRRVQELSEEITRSVGNYVIGQVCVAVLNATYAFIVMTVLHIPFSVLLAFVVALLAFIPLVGGLIAGIVVTLVALTAGWQTALLFAVLYFAYLQFEAYFVSPRIMQRAVAVPGSVAVISVIAGGSLLGVLGALIAIPTAAATMLLIKEIFITRQDQR